METLRQKALEQVFSRKPQIATPPAAKTSEYFGMYVFDKPKMMKYLSKEAYRAVELAIEKGIRIERRMADQIAAGMKAWALEMGATHYTHWFHPLTEGTAEKHDAFMEPVGNGEVIEEFTGKLLVQQEPDASSFPSGGIRSTFEARGYTAWAPSSPAFILDRTLCIPTIFISYTGEMLDNKGPLLKALHAVDQAATAVCQYFDKNVQRVFAYLGWEQEYFLIDEALYWARPDLVMTERTLMGHESAKNQQLEDQYFGSIPERVKAFMAELEYEAWKLGIPAKTRHNEIAPNQFEVAPVHEECNLAVDHNLLIMELMRRVARKHNFRVLLHEKPFKGVNGSGKHNNWSLGTDTGVNLLSPTKTPKGNLQFLTFLVNILKAVHNNDDLLKASIVSAGNAHRLGANEAPPAIISVFLGNQVSRMLDEIEKKVTGAKMTAEEKTALKLDIGRIPEILLDNTDRNRTSPFAFTGNRFEYRAVGSSANCASAMTTLNAAVAQQLTIFKKDVDALIKKGVKKDEAILQVLARYIKESKPIRFEGNNYSEEWKKEAKKRGLNVDGTVHILNRLWASPKALKLFEDTKVFNHKELEARAEIRQDIYVKKIQIESRVLGDLAMNHIVPVAIDYQTSLLENIKAMKEIFSEKEFQELASARIELVKEINHHISTIKAKVNEMIEARKVANKLEDINDRAKSYHENVEPYFEEIRYHIDKLELIVDDVKWPLPKYRELLFIR
ncbi:MAG TPA: glutamine synthetase III [Bacteroidales bacterium]|nr:glutamine synthetase III [Bacteroidales bacterium]